MKKLLFVLLSIITLTNVYAQPEVGRAGNANTVVDGRLKARLNMFMPVYADTTAANVSKGIDSCYAIIATRDVNGFWYRECSPKRWVRLMPSTTSSITNISITNITDSSVNIAICTGDGSCDTTTINNITIENPTTVELINDSTIVICNELAECDTANIGGQQFAYFFQNILTQSTPGIVEFGGEMLHTTTATYDGEELLILYTDRDIAFPNYPNTRLDPPITSIFGPDATGKFQAVPYVNQTRYGIVSGGAVVWVEDYDYHVSPATYYINGAPYASPDTTITLAAADATYDRIDAFVVNEDGEVEVLTGTPAADPQQPSVDPETQILLTFALVTAATTEPPDITSECTYQEGTEWTEASSTARINVASTSNPCGGTYNIEGTGVISGDYFTLTRGVAFDPRTSFSVLTFQIKSKGDWGDNTQLRRLSLTWRDGSGNVVGQNITFTNGSFGFDATNTSDCQTISIALSNFFLPNTTSVTQLRFSALVASGNFGFYIDNICLQGGGGMTPPTSPTPITSIGSLPPLFQTTTTAGATTFTQIVQDANTVFAGPASGADAAPTFRILVADDIPTDLGYYKTIIQITDTSVAWIRGDGTRDTVAVSPGDIYGINGITNRDDSTLAWGGTLDENTTIDGDNFYTRFTDTRVQFDMGANVAAANDLTLGNDGNLFTITGATQINAILTTNWQEGSDIAFIFTDAPLLKNNTAGGAGTATMLLAGRVDFQAAAGDYIGFRYNGTNWYETNRKLAASGGTYSFLNGLTESPAGTVKLGGTLSDATTTLVGGANTLVATFNSIASGNGVSITSTSTAAASNTQKLLNIDLSGANATNSQTTYGIYANNSHSGTGNTNFAVYGTVTNGIGTSAAIRGEATGGQIGVRGNTATGYGVYGFSSGAGIASYAETTTGSFASIVISNPSSTNTVVPQIKVLRNTSGSAANGIGGSIDFYVESTAGGSTGELANRFISKWVDATGGAGISQAIITGVLSGSSVDVLTLNANGSIQLRPITATEASAITPAEGQIVIVSDTNGTFTSVGFWGYSGGAWAKF